MFIIKYNELERCHHQFSNYGLIQASNPIRSLLLDGGPLVDLLNKQKRLPITYCVANQPFPSDGEERTVLLLWREINPDLFLDRVDLKKEAFLKYKCAVYKGAAITVLDILKFYASVRGGIHLDDGNKKQDPLREAFRFIKFSGISSLDHSMRGIVQVIYRTLTEYKERLLS